MSDTSSMTWVVSREVVTTNSPREVPMPPGSWHALTLYRGPDGEIYTLITPAMFRGATPELIDVVMRCIRDALMVAIAQ